MLKPLFLITILLKTTFKDLKTKKIKTFWHLVSDFILAKLRTI